MMSLVRIIILAHVSMRQEFTICNGLVCTRPYLFKTLKINYTNGMVLDRKDERNVGVQVNRVVINKYDSFLTMSNFGSHQHTSILPHDNSHPCMITAFYELLYIFNL